MSIRILGAGTAATFGLVSVAMFALAFKFAQIAVDTGLIAFGSSPEPHSHVASLVFLGLLALVVAFFASLVAVWRH